MKSFYKLFSLISLVALFVIGMGSSVHADTELGGPGIDAGQVSFGPRVAYFNAKGNNNSDWYGGAQLRVHLTSHFAVEGSVDYRQTEFGTADVDIFPVQASFLAYLMPEKRVTPFLLAGPGWYFTHVDNATDNDETDHRFGFHVGGGLQAFLNKHWSIDAAYRYVWVSDVEASDATLRANDYDDEGYMITSALNFHF